jgi:tight adherence protein C
MTGPILGDPLLTAAPAVLLVVAVTHVARNRTHRRSTTRRVAVLGTGGAAAATGRSTWRRSHSLVALAVLAAAASALIGPMPVVTALGIAWCWRRARPTTHARRRRRRIERELPDAIEMMVLAIRAGMAPVAACQLVGRRGPESTAFAFADVEPTTHRGSTFADAIGELPARLGPSAAVLSDQLIAADRYGTPLAAALDELARDARASRRRTDEAEARRLAVRMTAPLVTCSLPSFVLLAVAPAVMAALSSLPAGPLP